MACWTYCIRACFKWENTIMEVTARELGKRQKVKQKALRIAARFLAGLWPQRTVTNRKEKS